MFAKNSVCISYYKSNVYFVYIDLLDKQNNNNNN